MTLPLVGRAEALPLLLLRALHDRPPRLSGGSRALGEPLPHQLAGAVFVPGVLLLAVVLGE